MRNVDKAVLELIKDLKEKGDLNDKQYAEVLGELQGIKEIADFKRQCRMRSIELAKDMRPSSLHNSQSLGGVQPNIPIVYDLTKEADKIYEWLTKDINH